MKSPSLVRLGLAMVLSLAASPGVLRAQLENRKIQPNDVLVIRVLNEADMTAEKKVSNDGRINYFYIGDVSVAGKSVAEAQDLIRDLLKKDYLVDPQVNIEMRQYALEMVTVLGAVNKPGPVQLPTDRRVDVVELIGMAGDFNRYANKSRIELRRRGKSYPLSYDDLKRITDPAKKFFVEPDDVIEVGESKF